MGYDCCLLGHSIVLFFIFKAKKSRDFSSSSDYQNILIYFFLRN